LSDKAPKTIPTEIELSFTVDNLDPIIEQAKTLREGGQQELHVRRVIYKNDGDFHIRSSEESKDGETSYVISLKEDLMKQGVVSGMKKALEIDLPVSREQQGCLLDMFKLIGFKETTRFEKNRVSIGVGDVQIDLDDYDLPEGKVYNVEIEGPTEKSIYAVAHRLFPDGLPASKK